LDWTLEELLLLRTFDMFLGRDRRIGAASVVVVILLGEIGAWSPNANWSLLAWPDGGLQIVCVIQMNDVGVSRYE
jgi:hypothetical protein